VVGGFVVGGDGGSVVFLVGLCERLGVLVFVCGWVGRVRGVCDVPSSFDQRDSHAFKQQPTLLGFRFWTYLVDRSLYNLVDFQRVSQRHTTIFSLECQWQQHNRQRDELNTRRALDGKHPSINV
jgi:hypothetical protein